jgi:tetratricopeptide (TPR) repeat protein
MGRHAEAEKYCRAAIEINPVAYNAHKNLGVALQGLGRYADAARSYVKAIDAFPYDRRALDHLDKLLAAHTEILDEIPKLLLRRLRSHKAAQSAEGMPQLQ